MQEDIGPSSLRSSKLPQVSEEEMEEEEGEGKDADGEKKGGWLEQNKKLLINKIYAAILQY